MKLLRRLSILFLLLGLGLICSGFFVRHKARQRPAWYRHSNLDAGLQHVASYSMQQKLLATYGQANDTMAAATRAKFPMPPVQPIDLPPTAMTLELSEAEINSFFAEWDTVGHWRQMLNKFVVDPLLILEDNELILAGTVSDWNMVVSLHFEPKLENGKLDVGLKSVMVGTLPLPRATVDSYLAKINANVEGAVARGRQTAEINPRGWANDAAVTTAMGELLLCAMHDKPADPVIMVREGTGSRDARSIPIQITGVEIANKMLKLNLRTMTPDERDALEQRLQGREPAQPLTSAK